MPNSTLSVTVIDQANAGLRASTLGCRVAAIAYTHALVGLDVLQMMEASQHK